MDGVDSYIKIQFKLAGGKTGNFMATADVTTSPSCNMKDGFKMGSIKDYLELQLYTENGK